MLSNYEGKNHLVLQHSPLMAAKAAGLNVTWTPGHSLNLGLNDRSHIKDAVAAAKAADIAVVMVGLCADNCDKEGGGNGRGIEDEGFDRGRIALPGAQEQLLEAVVAAQPKTVMVMITGGAISISWCVVR
jgi:beta-glucosidase